MRIDMPPEQRHAPYDFAARKLAPEIMQAAAGFAEAVYLKSRLSLREFEAARTRIAHINGCMICQGFRAARDLSTFYPNSKNSHSVVDNGAAPDEAFYDAVNDWRNASIFSDRERLAIEFAERFAQEPKVLADDEDFWSRFRARFSDAETADLAHCVAAWMGLGRVAHVLGFDEVCVPTVNAA